MNAKLFGYCCIGLAVILMWSTPWLPVWHSASVGVPAGVTISGSFLALLHFTLNAFISDIYPAWFDSFVSWMKARLSNG